MINKLHTHTYIMQRVLMALSMYYSYLCNLITQELVQHHHTAGIINVLLQFRSHTTCPISRRWPEQVRGVRGEHGVSVGLVGYRLYRQEV